MAVAVFNQAYLVLPYPSTEKLFFQMLPQTINVSKSAEWVSTEVIGRSEPYRAYRSSSPRSISFSMRFFASVDAGDGGDPWDDIKRKADWLESLTYPERGTGYPPLVTFIFGNTFNSRCIVKSVNIKFEGPYQTRRPVNPPEPVAAPTGETSALSYGLGGIALAQNLVGRIGEQSDTAARAVSFAAGNAIAALNALGEQKPGEVGPHRDELLPMQAEASLVLDEINPTPRYAEEVRASLYQNLSAPISDLPAAAGKSFADRLLGLNNPFRARGQE